MSHTPGPWKWDEGYCGLYSGDAPSRDEDWVICYASYEGMWLSVLNNNIDANARLIAAAPDLLEALKTVLMDPDLIYTGGNYEPLDTCGFHLELRDKIRAAIAKAEGQ